MRSQDFRVDVSGQTGLPGTLSTAATIYMPERLAVPATVIFAFPGAGLTRHYFDMNTDGGYSQAQYHVSDGFIFVSCDHLATGDSPGRDPDLLDYENLAAANHATASTLLTGLRDGSLVDGLPPVAIEKVIGIGQAMGGCLVIAQQARHGTFDAVALLGWSGTAHGLPLPDADDEQVESALSARYDTRTSSRDGHVPAWRSTNVPRCAVTVVRPEIIAAQAAAITVPVLVVSGERDALADPWAEASAYRSSRLVTVAVIDGMAQLHNLASQRTELWDRISDFACIVRPRVNALI